MLGYDLLNSRRNDPYEAAIAALREDTLQWWADILARDPDELKEGDEPGTADAEGQFLLARLEPRQHLALQKATQSPTGRSSASRRSARASIPTS